MSRVLITGGGSGTGADMARAFAAQGHEIVIAGRSMERLARVAGGRIRAVEGDVGDPDQLRRIFEAAGPCQVVIANAGLAESAPFAKVTADHWQRMIATNLTGTFLTFQQGLAQMQAGGRLIAIASIAGLRGAAYAAPYAASKHGVVGLVRSLALELARREITVNAICPGFLDTDMTRRSTANIAARTGRSEDQARAALVARNPQGRLVAPAEVTAAALWLASEAAACVNGQAIGLDGGESA
ncbi:SDR family NAD(P)-dependent oxidoreductase [Paracoccus siganidrum]|uniref:SDR family oxidoreductase n=1 Tax=Paracoccus siganidrum TaxID=1276757 RepID=A0A419A6F8_9RHOB|nr:SDR family NAD(P)-dependent oxidoreductase [Paracoccus siganidrum]RJL14185.1 SDR family oxidoreductase [Paracoccus siganidrum]RMC33483.1 3-hydroxyacyl-CoA dehydrogenase [Paracoccus siganidrum]